MKIAYDAKRFFHNASGLGNYSRDLVRVLATHFPENQYLLFNKDSSERGRSILALPNVEFRKTSPGTLARHLQMGRDAQMNGADIFHGLSGELPLKWDKKSIKKVVTIHDLIFLRFPQYYSFADRKIHFWKFKNAAEQADVVIAISEQTKKDIVHYLKIPEEKIRVVYQGCHEVFKQDFNPKIAEGLSKKHGLPSRFILNVGTVEERKNVLRLAQALHGTEIPLVVVGKKKSGYFKKISKYIAENRMQKQIIFLENIDMQELATLYKMAEIFVYPSEFEGFGIPIIEALFSKTAVVTDNFGAMPEAGGSAALYVDPLNVEDLRSKILHLWNSKAERQRRISKGFAFVQKFQDEVIASELMKVYREIL